MIKAYARQIPPEYQESPLSYGPFEQEFPEIYPGISLDGNRHFTGYKTAEYEAAEHADDAAADYLNSRENDPQPMTIREALEYYGIEKTNGRRWSPRELGQWKRIFEDYDRNPYDGRNADRRVTDALELITGKPHAVRTLRGSSQGDYIKAYFPFWEYSEKAIECLETEYFNTGEEWEVILDYEPGQDDQDDAYSDRFTCYVYSWKDDEKRAEIADAAGVQPEEIEMHAFLKWARRAVYA